MIGPGKAGRIIGKGGTAMQAWIIQVMGQYGALGIFFLIFVENVFPPIPSEVILAFGGFMTLQAALSVQSVILAATLGSVAGAGPRLEQRWHVYGYLCSAAVGRAGAAVRGMAVAQEKKEHPTPACSLEKAGIALRQRAVIQPLGGRRIQRHAVQKGGDDGPAALLCFKGKIQRFKLRALYAPAAGIQRHTVE